MNEIIIKHKVIRFFSKGNDFTTKLFGEEFSITEFRHIMDFQSYLGWEYLDKIEYIEERDYGSATDIIDFIFKKEICLDEYKKSDTFLKLETLNKKILGEQKDNQLEKQIEEKKFQEKEEELIESIIKKYQHKKTFEHKILKNKENTTILELKFMTDVENGGLFKKNIEEKLVVYKISFLNTSIQKEHIRIDIIDSETGKEYKGYDLKNKEIYKYLKEED